MAYLRHCVVQVGGGVARAAGGAGVGAAVPRPGLRLREAGVHLGVGVGAAGSLVLRNLGVDVGLGHVRAGVGGLQRRVGGAARARHCPAGAGARVAAHRSQACNKQDY